MSALILHTFGILKHAAGHPASQAFMATSPGVTESVTGTPGLLKNSITSFMPDGTCMSKETELGIPPTPTFFEKDIDRYGLAYRLSHMLVSVYSLTPCSPLVSVSPDP